MPVVLGLYRHCGGTSLRFPVLSVNPMAVREVRGLTGFSASVCLSAHLLAVQASLVDKCLDMLSMQFLEYQPPFATDRLIMESWMRR